VDLLVPLLMNDEGLGPLVILQSLRGHLLGYSNLRTASQIHTIIAIHVCKGWPKVTGGRRSERLVSWAATTCAAPPGLQVHCTRYITSIS